MNEIKKWAVMPVALMGMLGLSGLIHNNIHADAVSVPVQTNTTAHPAQQSSSLRHEESDIQYQATVLHNQLIAQQMHKLFNEPQSSQKNSLQVQSTSSSSSADSASSSAGSSAGRASIALSQPASSSAGVSASAKPLAQAPVLLGTSNANTSASSAVGSSIPDGMDIAQRYSHGTVGWHAYLYNNGTTMTLTGDFSKYQPRYESNGHSVGNWYPNEEYDGYSGLLGNSLPVSDVDKILGRVKIVRLGNATNLYSLQAMFSNMPKLWSVVKVGNFNTALVSDMADTFHSDKDLTNISALSDWYTGRVKDMQNMFQSDDSLSDLTPLSNWDTHSVSEMNSMFAGSSDSDNNVLYNLKPLTRWDTSHVLSMGQMFANDINISDITPLANWDTSSAYAMANMFQSDAINTHPNWRPHHDVSIPGDSDVEDKTWRDPSDNTNPLHRKVVSDVIDYHNSPFTQHGLEGSNGQSILTSNGKLYNFVYNGGWHKIGVKPKSDQKPKQKVTPAQSTSKPVAPQPAYDPQLNLYIDTVNYTYQGKTVGEDKLAGNKGQSFSVGSNPSNLPSKYKVADPSQTFQYTGFSHTVPVELNEAAPVTMSLSNQNNATIGYVTLKNLGLVGQKVNIEPYLIKMMPKGYHLPSDQPIYITLSNGSSIIINA